MADENLCPVEGCDHPPFKTVQALQSHIRSKHPEVNNKSEPDRQVPIVEEDFATLLKKFKVSAPLASNIAENVSHTGGPKVFEDPEILLKRLTLWSSDITPARRKNIIEQWFAERGVDIPTEVQRKAGMTSEQIQEAEKKTHDDGDVRYIYDPEVNAVRMAKEGEKGGTLPQAKELKRMAEESSKQPEESPFMMNPEGEWVLNPKGKVTGIELMAFQHIQKAQEKGETIDPMMAMTRAAEQMRLWKEAFGGGGSSTPAWMTDPVQFTNAIKSIIGSNNQDSAAVQAIGEMQKTIQELKEERFHSMFESQQKQIQDLASVLNRAIEAITDIKKGQSGRTEMDIINNIATEGLGLAKTELPELRRNIKEALSSVAPPSPKTPDQRDDRKKKYKEALQADAAIQSLGEQLFFPKG